MKIGYKTFEYLCDLCREDARLQTWETLRALDQAQDACGWPWCLTQEQIDDWNALCQRLDPDPMPATRWSGDGSTEGIASMAKKYYLMDEVTMKALQRLTTACNALAAARGDADTQTPYGPLYKVAEPIGVWAIMTIPLVQCDYCEEIEEKLTRCAECDTHMCQGCYQAHKH